MLVWVPLIIMLACYISIFIKVRMHHAPRRFRHVQCFLISAERIRKDGTTPQPHVSGELPEKSSENVVHHRHHVHNLSHTIHRSNILQESASEKPDYFQDQHCSKSSIAPNCSFRRPITDAVFRSTVRTECYGGFPSI